MKKQKDAELSRMFAYAGNYHGLTVLGCVLAAVSTVLSMLPFVCIWFVIRDLIHAGGCRADGRSTLCVAGGSVFRTQYFTVFSGVELCASGGVSDGDQYAQRGAASYREAAARLF